MITVQNLNERTAPAAALAGELSNLLFSFSLTQLCGWGLSVLLAAQVAWAEPPKGTAWQLIFAEEFNIDVNEGHYPNQIATNIHKWSGQHTSNSKTHKAAPQVDLSREFHEYGLEWNGTSRNSSSISTAR